MPSMRAAVLQQIGVLAVEDRPTPRLVDTDDVIVRVRACGVCGTDLHILSDPPGYAAAPSVVLGHEIVGDVSDVGPEVTSVSRGHRVVIRPILTCGTCRTCLSGLPNHCTHRTDLGVWRDGGLAEFVRVPASACIPVSPDLPLALAALTEPLACVVNGVDRLSPRAGEQALVLGAGAIGLLFTAVLVASGVDVVVVEPSQRRADAARRLGATRVIDPTGQDVAGALSTSWPTGPLIVVDAVGSQLAAAVSLAAPRARVLLFGLNAAARPEVPQAVITTKELTVLGSFVGQHSFPDAVRLLEAGQLDLSPVVSHTVALAELPDLLPVLRRGEVIKAVVVLD